MIKSLNRCVAAMALTASLLMAGCASVGPDFNSPPANPELPAQFAHAPKPQPADAQADSAQPAERNDMREAAFWRQFGDPQLSAFVQQALHNNHDLGAAVARLQTAEALLSQADMDRLPTVTLQGRAMQQKRSAEQAGGAAASARSYIKIGRAHV